LLHRRRDEPCRVRLVACRAPEGCRAGWNVSPDTYQVIIHAGVRAVTGAEPAAGPGQAAGPEPAGVPAETPGPQPQAAEPAPAVLPFWHPAHEDRCHLDDGPATHDAAITPTTINPPHSGERLNLSLAIWTAFANARTQANRRETTQTDSPGH